MSGAVLDDHRLLDQLGDLRLVAGEVDVPARAGLAGGLVDVVALRLGLEQERADPVLLLVRLVGLVLGLDLGRTASPEP